MISSLWAMTSSSMACAERLLLRWCLPTIKEKPSRNKTLKKTEATNPFATEFDDGRGVGGIGDGVVVDLSWQVQIVHIIF